MEIKKNIPVKLDSINISGTLKLNKYFIYNFAGIKPGAIYNENKIINAGNRLRELSFATLEKHLPGHQIGQKLANRPGIQALKM